MSNRQPPLQFTHVDIDYNYVFDVGGQVNPIDAARRVLGTELGQAYRNYVTGKSEVADRYRVWAEAFEKLTRLRNDLEKIEMGQDLAGYLRGLLSNPRLYAVSYLSALQATLWPADHQQKRARQEAGDVDSIINDVAEAIADLLGLLAIQEHVDRQIFFSGYLESVPFARVGLQPFAVVMDQQESQFDVTLTIHRSGIAILTVYAVFSEGVSLDEVLRLREASKLAVTE